MVVHPGAPLDGFGVGGNLGVGLGTIESGTVGGTLGAVYKLVWYEGNGDPARIKVAGDKSTWPGRKQIVRVGDFVEDVIQLDDEPVPDGAVSLLHPVMVDGEQTVPDPDIMALREIAAGELALRIASSISCSAFLASSQPLTFTHLPFSRSL